MNNNSLYEPFGTIVIRTPLYSFDKRMSFDFDDPLFNEAIFVASPELSAQKEKQRDGYSQHMLKTLYKYWVRSATRSTPFGFFSSWSVGKIGDKDYVKIHDNQSPSIHVRFDISLLCRLIRHFMDDEMITQKLLFHSNDSIVRFGKKIHFVEYKNREGQREYYLQQADCPEELEDLLNMSKRGISLSSIQDLLLSMDVDRESAIHFINDLITSQILISELEINPIGNYPTLNLIDILNKRSIKNKDIQLFLDSTAIVNEFNSKNHIDKCLFERLHSTLSGTIGSIDKKHIIQVDSFRQIDDALISIDTVNNIADAISFLARVNKGHKPDTLMEFQSHFYERYEEQTVPLLKVLDQEYGIGYPIKHGSNNTEKIIEDVCFAPPGSSDSINLSPTDVYILRKMIEQDKKEEIVIEDDFKIDESDDDDRIQAPTASVLVSLIKNNTGQRRVCINASGGVSASALIGRVCYLDNKIDELYSEICSFEQSCVPEDTVIAEISHLPQDRTGNVILRPSKRKAEVHYLAHPETANENYINAADLMLDIKNGRLRLSSSITGKTIVPLLSNAHNYHNNPLPVYQFLCEYQHYYFRSFSGIDTSNILHLFKYTPRIVYKNVVLASRQWQVDIDDINTTKQETLNSDRIQQWRKDRKIPDEVFISQYDNDLYINFNNSLSLEILVDYLSRYKSLLLCELIGNPDDIINSPSGSYRGEFCISFHTKK